MRRWLKWTVAACATAWCGSSACALIGNDYDEYGPHDATGNGGAGGSTTTTTAGGGGVGGAGGEMTSNGGGGTGGTAGAGGAGGAGGQGPCLPQTNLQVQFDAGTLALNDGDPVISWEGTPSIVLNKTTALAPTYAANGINGQPAIVFDGVTSDQALVANLPWYFGGPIQDSPPLTVVLVARTLDDQQDQLALTYGQPAAQGGRFDLGICGCGNPRAWHFRMINNAPYMETLVQAQPGTQDTLPVIVAATMDPVTSSLHKNGVELAAVANNPVEFQSANPSFRIGSEFGGLQWNGMIAEVLVYSEALGEGKRQAVESCLAAKYAITLP